MDDITQDDRPAEPADVFAPVTALVEQAQRAVEQRRLDVAVQALDSVETALPQLRAYVARAA